MNMPHNKKIIILGSALCCLLIAGLNLWQKSWKTMDLIIFMGQSNISGAGETQHRHRSLPKEQATSTGQ